jgi:hypothetical protein
MSEENKAFDEKAIMINRLLGIGLICIGIYGLVVAYKNITLKTK